MDGIVPKISFDPLLFDTKHWNFNDDGQTQHRFQIFCNYYMTQLRWYPGLTVQGEIDGFIAMLHDKIFFSKVWNLLDALRRDAYGV